MVDLKLPFRFFFFNKSSRVFIIALRDHFFSVPIFDGSQLEVKTFCLHSLPRRSLYLSAGYVESQGDPALCDSCMVGLGVGRCMEKIRRRT